MSRFANISALSGIDFPDDGRAICLSDWDHDGDLDFWVSNRTAPQLRFLRNDIASGNHFLGLRLRATTGNRDAIGARVEVQPSGGGPPMIRTLRAGDGYLAQSGKWLLFGLGAAQSAARVEVRWPGGASQTIESLAGDRHYLLTQGDRAQPWKRPPGDSALTPSTPSIPPASPQARIPLVTLLQVPAMDYEAFSGERRPVRATGDRALLVNLWASWCAPCLRELSEFKSRAAELRAAGVDVLALAVDGVGQDETDPASTVAVAKALGLPFPAGRANEKILTLLERFHVRLTPMELELMVPMSILIDRQGRLAVFYKGPASVDQILADLPHSSKSRAGRLLAVTGLGGVALEATHPSAAAAADQLEVTQRFQFAQDMWEGKLLDDAAIQFRDTLALAPDFVEAVNNLGLVDAARGRHRDAAATYGKALELREDSAVVHFNLGLSLEQLSQPAEAEVHYRRALALDPGLAKVNNALGLLFAKRGDLEPARLHFQREAEINPAFADGHNHLGLIHLSLNAPGEAIAHFTRAIERSPGHADALNNLGIAWKRLGELEEAEAAFQASLEAAPAFVPAMLNLGLVHLERGDFTLAEKRFEDVLSLQPNLEAAHRNLERARALRLGK